MKLLPLLLLLLIYTSCGKEEPEKSNTPTEIEYIDGWEVRRTNIGQVLNMHFLNAAKGFCVTEKGLYGSLDSGKSWNPVNQLSKGRLFDIRFLNQQFGYCAGDSTFGYTNNGGQTWNFKYLNIKGVSEAHFISSTVGFLTSEGGLHKTIDGGENWVKQNNYDIRSLYFHDEENGWLGGQLNHKGILQTSNAGLTLTERLKTADRVLQIKFFDQQHGWANTLSDFLGTKDGGQTWTKLNEGPSFVLDFSYLNKDVVYISAGPRIIKSTDGGRNWETVLHAEKIQMVEVFFLDENTGWASTMGNKLFRFKK